MRNYLLSAYLLALPLTANSALVERLGGLAYYDEDADLTWLADANYAMTSGYDADGEMTWAEANTWAASLDVVGVTGWRLPETGVYCFYINCTSSEMGNMYYNVSGNSAGSLTNTGPFSNLQPYYYWSATEYVPGYAWDFSIYGGQGYTEKFNYLYAWAVHDGDVSPVPVPAAVWLFGSGLLGLFGVARRQKA